VTGCPLRVGIVGLGAGTLAAYAKPGDHFEFTELEPAVITAAEGRHFSYVTPLVNGGRKSTVVEGDGRQTLQGGLASTRLDNLRRIFNRLHSGAIC
jgi:hypothetical protein